MYPNRVKFNDMNVLELSEQEIIRRNSMNELRAMGIEPYPAARTQLRHNRAATVGAVFC